MKNCYVCGSPMEIDYSGCSEIAGDCYNTITIECTNRDCLAELTLTLDFCRVKRNCGDDLINLWDSLKKNDKL